MSGHTSSPDGPRDADTSSSYMALAPPLGAVFNQKRPSENHSTLSPQNGSDSIDTNKELSSPPNLSGSSYGGPPKGDSNHSINGDELPSNPKSSIDDSKDANDFPELPEAPPSRVFGQGYSAHHPVPTVQSYKSEKAKHDEEAKQYADMVEKQRQESEEREKRAAEMREAENGDVTKTTQVADEETNVAKTQKDKTNKPNANTGASEKARLMDQMNANQREHTVLSRAPAYYNQRNQRIE